jgi:uncharacterized integral membrane protein
VSGGVLAITSLVGILSTDAAGILIAIAGCCLALVILAFIRRTPGRGVAEPGDAEQVPAEGPEVPLLADVPYPPFPQEYQRAFPPLRDRLRGTPGRRVGVMTIICAVAAFVAIPGIAEPFVLINFNLGLVVEYYVVIGPAMVVGGIISYAILWWFERRPAASSKYLGDPRAALLVGVIASGISGAACILIAILVPSIPGDWIVLLGGGIPIVLAFGTLTSNEVRITDSNEPASRATRAFAALAVLFTIGFTANGIKAAFIYLFTFLTVVNGQLVVQMNFSNQLNWDVPALITLLLALLAMILLLVAALVAYVHLRRYRKNQVRGDRAA